ncbi:hypothetical protein THRCLA_20992 [Thraustotheca clavata]|uniref:Uncharacterized protein n=1 Tax=Thraustotheca clavata TaxID=74557 RepID=A0A1W0A1G0_9STRA|nr:hypothetical protein THRCLA_20992 [Thraustotheca clavata]
MSLVADYSDSDSDSEQEDTSVAAPCTSKPVALPSADDLFSGNVKASAFAPPTTSVPRPPALPCADDLFSGKTSRPSTSSSSNFLPKAVITKPNKRQHEEEGSSTKKVKAKTRSLLPPQLRNKRPNVSTEDLSSWNTRQTMKYRESSS